MQRVRFNFYSVHMWKGGMLPSSDLADDLINVGVLIANADHDARVYRKKYGWSYLERMSRDVE